MSEILSTQEKLIAAATTLFAEKGFAATSVKDIADAAGVNVSLVSYHFQGKENLYKTCIGNVGIRHYELTKQILQPVENAEEFKVRMQLLLESMLLAYAENPEVSKMVHREFDTPSPFFEDLFQSIFFKHFNVVSDYIAYAQKKGIVRQDLCATGMASVFLGSITHHGQTATLRERWLGQSLSDPDYRKQVSTIIIGIMTKGILL